MTKTKTDADFKKIDNLLREIRYSIFEINSWESSGVDSCDEREKFHDLVHQLECLVENIRA